MRKSGKSGCRSNLKTQSEGRDQLELQASRHSIRNREAVQRAALQVSLVLSDLQLSLKLERHSSIEQEFNSSNLTGEEGGSCPRLKFSSHSTFKRQLKQSSLLGEEGGL
jgi:hypothetical protein